MADDLGRGFEKRSALVRILEVSATRAAKGFCNAVALLGIAALIPGFELPPELTVIAGGIGVEAIVLSYL